MSPFQPLPGEPVRSPYLKGWWIGQRPLDPKYTMTLFGEPVALLAHAIHSDVRVLVPIEHLTPGKPRRVHTLHVTIDEVGVQWRVDCQSDLGAHCRLVCSESCGAEEWPCSTTEPDGTERVHRMIDGGDCQAIPFIEDCIDEAYAGDQAPLRSGPIDLTWNGVTYVWHYTDPDPTDLR